MKKNFLVPVSLTILLGAASCSNHSQAPAMPPQEVIKDSTKTPTYNTLTLLMTNVPAPTDIGKELASENIPVNKSILNSPDKSGNYSGTMQQAVNMGVYGADLGYLASYNQMQDVTNYMVQVAKMASALGISSAYDQNYMNKFKGALSNKDSVNIVCQMGFDQAQKELYSNKRASVSTLIFAGGWIEGLFIATNLITDEKTDKNAALYTKVWQHVYAFSYLQKVLTDYKDNADCASMLAALQPFFDAASQLNDQGLSLKDIQNLKQLISTARSKYI